MLIKVTKTFCCDLSKQPSSNLFSKLSKMIFEKTISLTKIVKVYVRAFDLPTERRKHKALKGNLSPVNY